MTQHYVAIAGLRGYMPNCLDVYATFRSACDSLIQIHDCKYDMLDDKDLAIEEFEEACEDLREYGFAEINLRVHGNEYMQITECNCDAPWEHSERPVQKVLEYLDYSVEQAREALKNENIQNYLEEAE